MTRILTLVYGTLSYAIGLGGLVYFIVFLSAWRLIPNNIYQAAQVGTSAALFTNFGLMLLFAVQHSAMARKSFKAQVTKIISPSIERSTYVLISGLLMFAISFYWRSIPGALWNLDNPLAIHILCTIQMLGWGLTVASSFAINHFELFGLQQVYYHFKGETPPRPKFTDRLFYKLVRHPLQLGVLIGIWVTPEMTMTHLFLSATMTIYVFVGLYYEEKDLVSSLGNEYVNYRKKVRMIIPIPKKLS